MAMDKTGIVLCTVIMFGVAATGCAKKTVPVGIPPHSNQPQFYGPELIGGRPMASPSKRGPEPTGGVPLPPPMLPSGPPPAHLEEAYFDYDAAILRMDAVVALDIDSAAIKMRRRFFPDAHFTIEGHCDERGSAEYNLALGDQRARAAMEYLVAAGVPAELLTVVSYGKDKPVCEEHTESCWQRNRRVHIVESGSGR